MSSAFRVEFSGDRRLIRALAKLRPPARDLVLKRAFRELGRELVTITQRDFLSGQLLNVRTGGLRASIAVDRSRLPDQLSVGSSHPGAGALHFGFRARGLRPRPFLERATSKLLPTASEFFVRAFERAVERGVA